MSFRRRKSRIGPGFQAVIPELLTIKQKEELKKVYDYEQSLAEHCLTISSLSSTMNTNNNNNNTTNHNNNNKQQYSIHDTHIDHRVDPICWDASKSIVPPSFNYQHYVTQYMQKPNQSLRSKMSKFQHKFSNY